MADSKVTDLAENTTVLGTDILYLVDDPGGAKTSQKATVTNVVAGGQTGKAAEYITSAASSDLSAEVVIPGLAGSSDIAGAAGAGTAEEYDSGASPFAWNNAPASETVDTIKSHLYVSAAADTEYIGLKAWSPAGAFDARCHVNLGSEILPATSRNATVGLIISDADSSDMIMTQINITLTATGYTTVVYPFKFTSSTWSALSATNSSAVNGVKYLRVTRDGSNNIACYFSYDGLAWIKVGGAAFTFTPTKIGYRLQGSVNSQTYYMISDWLRTDV
jgi:hypothetical protein